MSLTMVSSNVAGYTKTQVTGEWNIDHWTIEIAD